MIYLDHNASNPPDPRLVAVYQRALELGWANPSSLHAPGRRARALLEEAREQVAALAGVRPGQVTFTSSGTEALNQALESVVVRGGASPPDAPPSLDPPHRGDSSPRTPPRGRLGSRSYDETATHATAPAGALHGPATRPTSHRGSPAAPPHEPPRIVTSAVEHPAVRVKLAELAAAGRARVVEAPVDAAGRALPGPFAALVQEGAALAVLLAAQNEVGTLQPLEEVGAACAAAGVPLLVDASQAVGRLERDWAAAPWDYLVLSGHKLRAPRGAGALVHRGRAPEPAPLLLGGGQERGRRAGTEPVAAIAALGAACALAQAGALCDPAELARRRDRFEARLRERVRGLELLGAAAPRLPQTTAVLVPGQDSEALLAALDLAGVHASSGSACSSGALEPSHVLAAMGVAPERARGRLRFSFGPETTDAELERAVEVLAALAP